MKEEIKKIFIKIGWGLLILVVLVLLYIIIVSSLRSSLNTIFK